MATTDISCVPVDPKAAQYRLALLGSFALQRPDGSLVQGLGRKARALIAFVAMAKDPVERGRLAELLWSDRGRDQARASLRQTFYELRQQLPAEPPLLLIGPDRISLANVSVAIDIEAATLPNSELLLQDLDCIDPVFDRWLNEERARLGGASSREKRSSLPLRPMDSDEDEGCKPVPWPFTRPSGWGPIRPIFAGVAFAVVAGVAGLIALSPHGSDGPERVVMVEPLAAAGGDLPARTLADGLATAIERDVVGTATPVRIADAATSPVTRPALILRGNATSRDGRLHANVALVAADNTVIWSGTFDRPPKEAAAMIDQMGLQVARELHFAFANGRNVIFDRDPEAIRLSLAAGDAVGRDFGEAARYSAQLLARAPLFARGWAESATNAVEAAEDLPDRARAEANAAAAADARRALAIDPHQGLAYFAIAESLSGLPRWVEREHIVARGLAADPGSPELNASRADDLAAIGRLQEAAGYAQRAFALDHFLPGKVALLARMDMDVGNLDAAREQVRRGRTMWPDQHWPDALAFELAMYWGDPAEARALLDAGRLPWRHSLREADLAFLAWRMVPSGTSATAAARAIEATARNDGAKPELVQQLAALGRIDAAYRLAAALPPASAGDSRWYRDYLASFRADPRFMTMADRQGMAAIWRRTRIWPEFCAEKSLRYRCASKAA
jgi:tetratricopeptide (TPR) repeat protein